MYADIIFQQAQLYSEMGNKEKALPTVQEAMKILEKLNMKGTEIWQNCVNLKEEIKSS